jgi:hypothetical protein
MIKSYLKNLFRHNKKLFFGVCIFFMVNILANSFFATQITPIYNWNLYAAPIEAKATYTFFKVRYDGKILSFQHTWKEPRKLLLMNTLNYFMRARVEGQEDYAKEHFINDWLPRHPGFRKAFAEFRNYNDERELDQFPHWFKKILEQEVGEDIDEIKIFKTTVVFLENGSLKEISSTPIYTIK